MNQIIISIIIASLTIPTPLRCKRQVSSEKNQSAKKQSYNLHKIYRFPQTRFLIIPLFWDKDIYSTWELPEELAELLFNMDLMRKKTVMKELKKWTSQAPELFQEMLLQKKLSHFFIRLYGLTD